MPSTRRCPKARSSFGANCIAAKPPQEPASKIVPSVPLFSAKWRWTSGIRASHDPPAAPSAKNMTLVAILPRHSSLRVCLYFGDCGCLVIPDSLRLICACRQIKDSGVPKSYAYSYGTTRTARELKLIVYNVRGYGCGKFCSSDIPPGFFQPAVAQNNMKYGEEWH